MKRSVVGIYTNGEYVKAIPYIYDGEQWVSVKPSVYMDEWRGIGGAGTLFYNFLEHTGLNYNSTDNVLIREEEKHDRWIDKNGKVMNITDHFVTTGSNAVLRFVLQEGSHFTLYDSDHKLLKDSASLQLLSRRQ